MTVLPEDVDLPPTGQVVILSPQVVVSSSTDDWSRHDLATQPATEVIATN